MINSLTISSDTICLNFLRHSKNHTIHLLSQLLGLSSYADSPSGAAESISRLLAEAKSFIPESGWAQTPLTLRATAGLRLLPKDQSDAIIGKVRDASRAS